MADKPTQEGAGGHVHGGITMGAPGSHGSGGPPPVAAQEEHHASHPNWKFYVLIGLALTIITGIEVAIFYIPQLATVLVPTLLVLSAGKFITVVLFYMHLKFDSPIFGRVFFAPMLLAMLVVVALIVLFKVLPAYDVWR
jgi:cytochrome c oxidase subunit 4